MSEHLPECYMPERADWTREWECICHRLRDCERRVEIEQMDHLKSHRDEWVADGYARALEDAIAAVAEVGQFDYPDGEDSDYIVAPRDVGIITAVLAAISDLKAVQHG